MLSIPVKIETNFLLDFQVKETMQDPDLNLKLKDSPGSQSPATLDSAALQAGERPYIISYRLAAAVYSIYLSLLVVALALTGAPGSQPAQSSVTAAIHPGFS